MYRHYETMHTFTQLMYMNTNLTETNAKLRLNRKSALPQLKKRSFSEQQLIK